MVHKRTREAGKRALSLSRVKLLYARITLNRCTRWFFVSSLVGCIVLAALQLVTHADNSQAVNILGQIIYKTDVSNIFPVVNNGVLVICNGLPKTRGTKCRGPADYQTPVDLASNNRTSVSSNQDVSAAWKRSLTVVPVTSSNGQTDGLSVDTGSGEPVFLSTRCVQSLTWLHDNLRDAKREDVVTLCFSFWVFSLSLLAIMNESIPHLGAALVGHILGTGWASFRISDTVDLRLTYYRVIVSKNSACRGVDLLGSWWDVRLRNAIPILVMNVVALAVTAFFAIKLFKVYTSQSFSRVGGSARVHGVYKAVLLLSVALQLAAFFSLASMTIWVEKLLTRNVRTISTHFYLYLATFIVTVVLTVPWLVFGWISVRRERRWMFNVFGAISLCILTIYTLMFSSPLYCFIFATWPFFATMTVTSYILIVLSCILGVVCRTQFGRGLAQFLSVLEALENVDFTPVYFTAEKDFSDEKAIPRWSVMPGDHPVISPIRPAPPSALYRAQTRTASPTLGKSVSFAVDLPSSVVMPPPASLPSPAKERVFEMPASSPTSITRSRSITQPTGLPTNPRPLHRAASSQSNFST